MITVVPAQPSDAQSIAELQRDTWLATYPNAEFGITREDIADKFADMRAIIERRRRDIEKGNGQAWVAKDDGRVVGWAAGERGEKPRLGAMYVLPEHQGKGVGRVLMATMLDWFGDERDIVLEVASYNQEAIVFYERHGFRRGSPVANEASHLPSGVEIPQTEMTKVAPRKGTPVSD